MDKNNYCGLLKNCGLQADENHKELCSFFWSSNDKHEHCSMRSVKGDCGSAKAHQDRINRLLDNPWGCDG